MSAYGAVIRWRRDGDFAKGHYSRLHEIEFDGATVRGSASLGVAPAPYAVSDAIDPEEMFVASLSTCHLLWFLDVARRAGVIVEAYEDQAEGTLAKNAEGQMVMTRVILRPRVESTADPETLDQLHHKAHGLCFIANSVKSEVLVEPR